MRFAAHGYVKWKLSAFGFLVAVVVAITVWAVGPVTSEHVPQRVLLGITEDPAHSQIVTWRAATPVESPQAQIASWSGSPSFGKSAVTVKAHAEQFTTGSGSKVVHYAAKFTNLEPGKHYGYRVGDGTTWSEWFHIRTASEKADPFRFIFLGDAQSDVKSLWSRTVREAFKTAPDASLVLHAGDLINDGFDDGLWGEWSDGIGFIGAMLPNLPAVGNHDMNQPKGAPGLPKAVYPLWKAHFALPQNGPADAPLLEGEAYWVDYQGVRFICIEGNAYSRENYDPEVKKFVQKKQIEWVERLLAKNPNRWTIMLHHEPMYGVGNNPDNPELRDAFLALYDKYHVDLVLQGHDHVYARSHKLAGGKIVGAGDPGTVYVVSVSGPKMYPFNPKYKVLMKKVVPDTQMFQVAEVTGDHIRLDSYSTGGERVDGFELKKNRDGQSTLVELTEPARQ